jgi:hypothetical protein
MSQSTSQPNNWGLKELEAKAEELTARMRKDADFVRRLVNDPKTTLLGEGVPENAIAEMVRGDNAPTDFQAICISTTHCFLSISACCGSQECLPQVQTQDIAKLPK